jgi:hypothetical protein
VFNQDPQYNRPPEDIESKGYATYIMGVKEQAKQETSMEQVEAGGKQSSLHATCFHAGFLLGLLFDLKMKAQCLSEALLDF